MAEAVIVAGARTPIGKLSGALAGFTAMDLGGFAIAEALRGPACRPTRSTTCSWARCILAGPGPDHGPPGRGQGWHPDDRPGQHHQQGVPLGPQHDLPGRPDDPGRGRRHRGGRRHGVDDPGAAPAARAPGPASASATRTLVDSMMYDGLTDSFDHIAMGLSTEQHNQTRSKISRERQDAFAAASHEKAAAAAKDGRLAEEIVPVRGAPAQGRPAPGRHRRGRAPGHHGRVARRPEAGLRQERHHHGRQRVADLRRRARRDRDVGGQGQGARASPRSARSSATAWWPDPTTRC